MIQNIIKTIQEAKSTFEPLGIKFNDTLIKTLYVILKAYYIDKKQYVLLQAPTGTGKSIIGLMTAYCCTTINEKYIEDELLSKDGEPLQNSVYYLTSTKILQDQLNKDVDRFNLEEKGYAMLKGVDNYPCTYLVKYAELRHKPKMKGVEPVSDDTYKELLAKATYKYRACYNVKGADIASSQYGECSPTCPYKCQREKASDSKCAIINYHYFMSVMRMKVNPHFKKRFLTICDESHKLNNIIDAFCSFDLTFFQANNINSMINKLKNTKILNEYKTEEMQLAKIVQSDVAKIKKTFEDNFFINKIQNVYKGDISSKHNLQDFLKTYQTIIKNALKILASLSKDIQSNKNLNSRVAELIESASALVTNIDYFLDMIYDDDVADLYIEQIQVSNSISKFSIKNINTAKSSDKLFLTKNHKILFMSATMGNMNEFIDTFKINPDDCEMLDLPSTFDFSKSPIYLCKTGYLTIKQFDKNIETCILQAINICFNLHPNDKGIIHTHTLTIRDKFIECLYKYFPDDERTSRFLISLTASEKKENIERIKNEDVPYVLVGTGLTEGLDLKDDTGRFNILIKVPYPPITEYAKRKMELSEFWYNRTTKQDIVQAIGRTNRNTTDYSSTYLIDTKFKDIVFELDQLFVDRLKQYNFEFSPDIVERIKKYSHNTSQPKQISTPKPVPQQSAKMTDDDLEDIFTEENNNDIYGDDLPF